MLTLFLFLYQLILSARIKFNLMRVSLKKIKHFVKCTKQWVILMCLLFVSRYGFCGRALTLRVTRVGAEVRPWLTAEILSTSGYQEVVHEARVREILMTLNCINILLLSDQQLMIKLANIYRIEIYYFITCSGSLDFGIL